MSTFAYATQLYTVQDGIVGKRFNRPTLSLLGELFTLQWRWALVAADADPEVRVIILCVNDEGLSAGLDLKILKPF